MRENKTKNNDSFNYKPNKKNKVLDCKSFAWKRKKNRRKNNFKIVLKLNSLSLRMIIKCNRGHQSKSNRWNRCLISLKLIIAKVNKRCCKRAISLRIFNSYLKQ